MSRIPVSGDKILIAVKSPTLKEFLEEILSKQNFQIMPCNPKNVLKDILRIHQYDFTGGQFRRS